MRKGAALRLPRCGYFAYFNASSTATATETVIPTMGERWERRRWREKRPERVAAVGKTRDCFDRRSGCRAPQQDDNEKILINAGMVELVDTLDLGSNERSYRFESCYPHQ